MDFYSRIDDMLSDIEEETGLSKHRLLIELGLDPTQFRAYRKAGRVLSNPMLVSISKSPLCPYTLNTLMAWKALQEFGEEVIEIANKIVKKDRKQYAKK
jgi:hypothetical protein